jgi:hypothetical protein
MSMMTLAPVDNSLFDAPRKRRKQLAKRLDPAGSLH